MDQQSPEAHGTPENGIHEDESTDTFNQQDTINAIIVEMILTIRPPPGARPNSTFADGEEAVRSAWLRSAMDYVERHIGTTTHIKDSYQIPAHWQKIVADTDALKRSTISYGQAMIETARSRNFRSWNYVEHQIRLYPQGEMPVEVKEESLAQTQLIMEEESQERVAQELLMRMGVEPVPSRRSPPS